MDFSNQVIIQWIKSTGQTPITVSLPLAKKPRVVAGNSADHNDGFINVVGIYNYTSTGFTYMIGTNTGALINDTIYLIVIC